MIAPFPAIEATDRFATQVTMKQMSDSSHNHYSSHSQSLLIASPVESHAAATDEEPEDQKFAIEMECAESKECKPIKARYDACAERFSNGTKSATEENCVEVWSGGDCQHVIGIFRLDALCAPFRSRKIFPPP